MVMICHCRQIDDKKLTQAFQALRDASNAGKIESVRDLEPLLGATDCGGCSRLFERAVQNFNETGDIGIFKRARESESGLCSTARNRDYSAAGIPNLRMPAIDATK